MLALLHRWVRLFCVAGALLALVPGVVVAQPAPTSRLLTLEEALRTAEAGQPQLRQARANVTAAEARTDQARMALLPQLITDASYQRTTANFVARPGLLPRSFMDMLPAPTLDTFNFWSFGATLSQQVLGYGVTVNRLRAAQASAAAQQAAGQTTRMQVHYSVRTAYFTARAQRSLIGVARETLANQERRLRQIEGFVRVGTRPEIDLAQARTDRANAQVQLINAENGYQVAKLQLNQIMGVDRAADYDVQDESLPPQPGEDAEADALVGEALRARPEFESLAQQLRAQQLSVSAARGAYAPTLALSTGLTAAGTDLSSLAWNWNITAALSWSTLSALTTQAVVREAGANLTGLSAQRDAVRLQIRVDVAQAQLQVRAAKAAVAANAEAVKAARERLRLAEGRYQAGLGNIIELSDAQVAVTSAAAQQVQAEYNVATARALLLRATGRDR